MTDDERGSSRTAGDAPGRDPDHRDSTDSDALGSGGSRISRRKVVIVLAALGGWTVLNSDSDGEDTKTAGQEKTDKPTNEVYSLAEPGQTPWEREASLQEHIHENPPTLDPGFEYESIEETIDEGSVPISKVTAISSKEVLGDRIRMMVDSDFAAVLAESMVATWAEPNANHDVIPVPVGGEEISFQIHPGPIFVATAIMNEYGDDVELLVVRAREDGAAMFLLETYDEFYELSVS